MVKHKCLSIFWAYTSAIFTVTHVVQHCTAPHSTVLYLAALYCTGLFCTVLSCTKACAVHCITDLCMATKDPGYQGGFKGTESLAPLYSVHALHPCTVYKPCTPVQCTSLATCNKPSSQFSKNTVNILHRKSYFPAMLYGTELYCSVLAYSCILYWEQAVLSATYTVLYQYVVFAHWWMLCCPVGYVERGGPYLPWQA